MEQHIMEVWEKINYLLQEKQISKQSFIHNLLALNPILKRTGEPPSKKTILGYLYGQRELKIELIPYIAEVLGVSEQELFSFEVEWSSEYNVRYSKEAREILSLLPYVPHSIVKHTKERFLEYKKLHEKTMQN
jgi:transcriptional regulator with XRE-family HTH domain